MALGKAAFILVTISTPPETILCQLSSSALNFLVVDPLVTGLVNVLALVTIILIALDWLLLCCVHVFFLSIDLPRNPQPKLEHPPMPKHCQEFCDLLAGSWTERCVKPLKLSRESIRQVSRGPISYRICFILCRSFSISFFLLTGVRLVVENSTYFY